MYVDGGFSEKQIAQKLGLTMYKVRGALDKHNVQRRTRSEAIRSLYITRDDKKPFSIRKNLTQAEEALKLAGVMLYWGEGTKRGSTVSFANSDPEMIHIFIMFLRKICGIHEKRMRIALHYYADQSESKLVRFWSKLTNIPVAQFNKSLLHKTERNSGTYRRKSPFGTVAVRYSDKRLLEVIVTWIDEYKKIL